MYLLKVEYSEESQGKTFRYSQRKEFKYVGKHMANWIRSIEQNFTIDRVVINGVVKYNNK